MDMPAHFTTVRGRGGFGSSTQKLCDIFFQIVTSASSSTAIQMYGHFYVGVKTADAITDANMKVTYGFPLNTFSAAASKKSANDGALALGAGLKIHVAAAAVPLADYYGFYVPRMIPFYKATGGNEIEVLVSSARAVQCWSWGSYNGNGWATVHNAAWATFFANKYFALLQYAQLNMIICKVGTAAGTATTGDTIVIPTTQTQVDGTDINNPLPLYGVGLSSDPTKLATAANSNAKNFAIMAGTDQYLGHVKALSNANTALNLLYSPTKQGADNASPAVALPTAVTALNDNASSRVYDIVAKTGSEWVIGHAKLAALLRFKGAAAVTWSDPQSVMAVCGSQAGSVITTTTEMSAGNAGTGDKCTGAFSYTVGAENPTVVDGYTTLKNRWCRYCSTVANSGINEVYLKDYVGPTTSTRKIKGLTVWASDTAGTYTLAVDTTATATLQESVVIGSGGCGKSGQTTKKSTKGQTVEFTMKSPVALCAAQGVLWEDITSGGVKNWQLSGTIPASSVKCTCGTHSWSTTLTKLNSGARLQLVMPASASGATTEVICDKGDLSCKVQEWSSGSGAVTEMTASCYACDSGDDDCAKADSATAGASGKGVVRYLSSVTFTMKQDGTASTDVLKVKDVNYQPNSKTAIGRFYFKPSTTMSLYATSTIAYTFGSQTFGTGALCQVFTSSGTAPSMTPSDLVSNCVISGSSVTVTMAKDSTANFHVQVTGMDAWLASASNKVTGTVTNFGTAVQTQDSDATKQFAMAVVGTTATASNEPLATMTAVVARSLVNVMDIGMISFTITPKGADFGADGLAYISFPTYYNPHIGCMMRCALYDTKAKADGERLYCSVAWDYTLRVMGPSTAQKKDAAFELRVYGVQMNLHAAAGNFGVGLTNATYWGTHKHLTEFKAAADTTTGVWGGKLAIDVTSIALSSSTMRSTADITLAFKLPVTTDTVTAASDYVAVTLPFQWMGVAGWADGTAQASAALKLVTTTGTGTAAKTTKTAVKGKVSQLSGCTVVFALDTTATKLAEGSSYEFTLSSVPTAESATGAAAMNLGSVVLSVGKVATGGFGYSSAQLFNSLKSQTTATGIDLLEFSSGTVAVSRGTYTKNAVCIQPAAGNFKANVAVSVQGTAFKISPASLAVKMGAASACAAMGTASTTQLSKHCVRWTVNNGTKLYSALPTLMASVNGNTATVTVPDKVTCSLGGSSVPIVVTASAVPFSDIKVSLTTSIAADEKKTDNSVGITPNAGEVVTLKIGSDSGVLGFKCAATVTGKELKYKLDGTDKAVFALSASTIAVTAAKAGTKPSAPAMKLAAVTAGSNAASTIVEGECPGMGGSWINLQPRSWAGKPLAAVADVRAAHGKFKPGAEGNHKADQWCYAAVAAAGAKTKCTFSSYSKGEYSAALYCETIEGWFFASAKTVNVTAADNGGKQVSLTLTYKKAISDITNNDVVLNVCCKLAEAMAVPYDRVTDAYGGYCGVKSPSLPAKAPAPATPAATNTTSNATKKRVLATNATTNATKPAAQTEWKLNVFVQPDPFATKADNAATTAAATGKAALAAVDGVTKATYGAMTAKAAVSTEAAVKWVKKPAATGGAKQITVAGSTDVAGYVYCAVSKTASRLRMLNTTANASNTTAAPKPAAPKATEAVSLQSAATAAKYTIQRQETATGKLAFSLVFSGLGEGKTYSWMCEATSLNPIAPQFRTAMEKGTAATSAPPPVTTGDSALWSSLFAAVLMIAAVFFY